MAPPGHPISPDGNYWWDGQAWRPMPEPAVPAAVQQQPQSEAARPSWLPQETEIPEQPMAGPTSMPAEPEPVAYAPAYQEPAAPAWAAPQPSRSSTTPIMIAAGAALALMVGGVGVFAFMQSVNRSSTDSSNTANASATATPSISASPAASPVAAAPLTGQMDGHYCPVAHPNDSACWKGAFVNTGPAIRQLALMFVIGGGYEDWFAHHANGTLSGFYTTAGCDVDAAHSRIVCGGVPSGGRVDVYLGGDVTTRGTFNYAVKFADISSGSPAYVNQHPDGTHDVVSWTEVIT